MPGRVLAERDVGIEDDGDRSVASNDQRVRAVPVHSNAQIDSAAERGIHTVAHTCDQVRVDYGSCWRSSRASSPPQFGPHPFVALPQLVVAYHE